MKGYESRVWVCWPMEEVKYTRPRRCAGDSHSDCGEHDVLVPISFKKRQSEGVKAQKVRAQGEVIRE